MNASADYEQFIKVLNFEVNNTCILNATFDYL